MAKRDYYEVLSVAKDATQDDIKKAYRRLSRKYHPDVSKETDAEAKFKELGEAYGVLKDESKRADYDRFGFRANERVGAHGAWKRGGGSTWEDLVRAAQAAHAGNGDYQDTVQEVAVPLGLMVRGGHVSVGVPRSVIKKAGGVTFHQTTTVETDLVIPQNAKKGQKIVLEGGKITLILRPVSDHFWTVNGMDVSRTLTLNALDAMMGTTEQVMDPWGRNIAVKVPAGTGPDTLLGLRDCGIEDVAGRKGDMHLRVKIMVPKLNDEQQEILRKAVKKIRS